MAVATARPDVVDSHGATLRTQNLWIGGPATQILAPTTTVYTTLFKEGNGTTETAAATFPMFVSLKMTVFLIIHAPMMRVVSQKLRDAVTHVKTSKA